MCVCDRARVCVCVWSTRNKAKYTLAFKIFSSDIQGLFLIGIENIFVRYSGIIFNWNELYPPIGHYTKQKRESGLNFLKWNHT